jgi:transposase
VDFCVFIGKTSFLPVSYSLFPGRPGNIRDDINAVEKYSSFVYRNNVYVLGPKYYNQDNLNFLTDEGTGRRFVLRVKQNAKGVFEAIKNKFLQESEQDLSPKKDKFYLTDRIKMGERKMYAHAFKNRLDMVAATNATQFNLREMQTEASLDPGLFREDDNYRFCLSFFPQPTSPTGFNVEIKLGLSNNTASKVGWTILVSNSVQHRDRALYIHEKWGLVEKAFNNLNDFTDMYNFSFFILKSSTNDVVRLLNGRLFTSFLSLILLSHIDHVMYTRNLYGNLSIDDLFEELSQIKSFHMKKHSVPLLTDLTDKQRQIFRAFSIKPPGNDFF